MAYRIVSIWYSSISHLSIHSRCSRSRCSWSQCCNIIDMRESVRSSSAKLTSQATLTISYLIMQSFNASQLRHRQWHGSWLAQACVQLPRIQIVCWLITTAVTLWKAVNLPLCQNTNADKSDEDAWHEGLGCWVFRVLVSLDVVIL